MKISQLLPLAALSTAFVIPDEQVMSQVAIESHNTIKPAVEKVPCHDHAIKKLQQTVSKVIDNSRSAFDQAVDYASDASEEVSHQAHESVANAQAWLDSAAERVEEFDVSATNGHHGHPKPNQTVYQLIAASKYTTKLAALINEFPDLVLLLNSIEANYTVFAPTDKAFEKIPEHAPKPSKEELKKILSYHVSPEAFPAGRVLVTHTIPSLLNVETLGIGPQRLATEISLKGLTVNFYSRIIAVDIFGTNGVIHGVDSVLVPPPKVADIISFLPSEFSTLELGLTKTGLFDAVNDTSTHVGGTFFAPSNFAFQKLGPKITGFLFSKYGQKYLKALLEYHIVANQTLYSDAYYKAESTGVDQTDIPKGYFHIDLKTALKDKSLSVDVARYGRFIRIKINGFATVAIEDGVASDGVIQVVSDVLIPPKAIDRALQPYQGEEISVEDLKERLEPLVEEEVGQEL